MKKLSLGFLAICLAFLVGCAKKDDVATKPDNSKQIIKVNAGVITENMFNEMMDNEVDASFLAQRKIDLKDPQNRLIYLIFKDRVVNELIIKELLNQEIAKRRIEISDKEVDKSIQEIVTKLGGKDKFESTLALNNIDPDKFRETVKNDLKLKKLINSLAITAVTENDVKKFYNENKAQKFTYPDMVRAKHILVSAQIDDIKARVETTNPGISPAELDKKVQEELNKAKAKAENILKQVKANPEKFDQIAKAQSEDPSTSQNGGDLGFFTRKDMVKPFSDAAFALKPDSISDVVKTDFGYHIIKVVDRKKAGITPLEEVKAEIHKYLEDQSKVNVLQKFIEGLKNTAKITYLDEQYDPAKIQNEIKVLAKSHQPGAPAQKTVKAEKK